MNNKAFTLIEVMATVLIIAAIALLSYPVLTSVVKKNKDIEKDTFKENAILAAKTYCNLNNSYDEDGSCSVSVQKLIEESYLDKPNNENIEYSGLSINCNKGNCKYKYLTAVERLLAKSNDISLTTYEQGSDASHQMYTFEHPATEQTDALTDYRYIGSDPYNYAKFNCDDNGENCEIWRIVGIFTVENGEKKEQRIKLIRDDQLNDYMAWDNSNSYNSPNEWSTATLNTYLNGDYYNNVLTESAKSMIEPAKYYLGGGVWDDTTHYGSATDMYTWERGTARYITTRSTNWTSNVGLLYPSDYYYIYDKGIDNVCYSDGYNCYTSKGGNPELGWLYKSTHRWWLVSPGADESSVAFDVSSRGRVSNGNVSSTLGVRPVVYLVSDISVEAGGDGSQNNPYEFVK